MRLLKINNTIVDIDEQTAIGVTKQCYDIKQPGKRFVTVTNQFTIPATYKNLRIFGNASNVQSTTTKVYTALVCDYWVNNEKLIDSAKLRCDKIDDRISVFVFQKDNIWDILKTVKWPDFITSFLPWMYTNYSLPVASHPYTGTVANFLDPYINPTSGIILPFYAGNFYKFKPGGVRQVEVLNIVVLFPLTIDLTWDWDFTSALTGTVTGSFNTSAGCTEPQYISAFVASLGANTDVSNNFDITYTTTSIIITAKEPANNDSTLLLHSSDIPEMWSTAYVAGIAPGTNYLDRIATMPTTYGNDGQIYLKYATNDELGCGGHFSIFVKTIFEYIESTYNVDFMTAGGTVDANIWDDPYALLYYVTAQHIDVVMSTGSCYFKAKPSAYKFLPHKDQEDKADKTLYDFVNAFFQHFNIIIDEIDIGTIPVFALRRFDDIEDKADVQDFSGMLSGKPVFYPTIEGYAQNNLIKFKEIYPEGNKLINSKTLTCLNVNIDKTVDLFEIDAYVPSMFTLRSQYIPNMSDKEALKTFTFFRSNGTTANTIQIVYLNYVGGTSFFGRADHLQIAQLCDLASEYTFLDTIINYPRIYEVDKWISQSQFKNLEFFKQYFIKELNGCFFINKIEDYNPEKSNVPTKMQLIKISDKTVYMPQEQKNWLDGEGEIFIDGVGENFVYLD